MTRNGPHEEFEGRFKRRYVSGSPPKLLMFKDQNQDPLVLRIDNWNTDDLTEYLRDHLVPAYREEL
ncbi:hypothetical protein ACOME3_000697 [Neoechinorhynchus agilis]